MNNRGSLSRQQALGALARFDLATGYPRIQSTLPPPSASSPTVDVSWSDHECVSALERAARGLLGVRDELSLVATLSGTVALDRCLRVGEYLAADAGKSSVLLVTHEHSIDLARGLVSGRPGWDVRLVGCEPGRSNLAALSTAVGRLRASDPDAFLVVEVTSPNNPDGRSVSLKGWRELSDVCAGSGAFLVVDHCFLLADPFRTSMPAAVWDAIPARCHWAAIWDTGKTLNLGGAKFGFILADSDFVSHRVVRAVEEIHVNLARDHAQLMAAVLSDTDHFRRRRSHLLDICVKNFEALRNGLRDIHGLRLSAGLTFACVHLSDAAQGDGVGLQEELLRRGVAVVSSESFSGAPDSEFVRVSLARDPEYFNLAVAELAAASLQWLARS